MKINLHITDKRKNQGIATTGRISVESDGRWIVLHMETAEHHVSAYLHPQYAVEIGGLMEQQVQRKHEQEKRERLAVNQIGLFPA